MGGFGINFSRFERLDQQMCVFLVIAWLMSKTPLFIPLMQVTVRLPHKFLCYIVFSIFCIMGTWFGLHIDDSIANTRAIGAVMGGLLGGPVVGGLVGLTGGLHRYSMGGMTALSCMISTIVEGLLGGLVHSILIRRGRTDGLNEVDLKSQDMDGILVTHEHLDHIAGLGVMERIVD